MYIINNWAKNSKKYRKNIEKNITIGKNIEKANEIAKSIQTNL